jgi:hypothetical protein
MLLFSRKIPLLLLATVHPHVYTFFKRLTARNQKKQVVKDGGPIQRTGRTKANNETAEEV